MSSGDLTWGEDHAVAPASMETRARPLSAAEAAWLAVLPCAVLVLAAIVALGPALGTVLFPKSSLTFWPSARVIVLPEPTEQARYLIALSAPLLLTALTLLALRRAPRLLPQTIARAVSAVQALGLAFVVVCLVVQRATVFGSLDTRAGSSPHTVYFTLATLLVAVALAGALVAGLRSDRLRERAAALARETRARRLAAIALAVVLVAISVLPAVNFEGTVEAANGPVGFHLRFSFDETAAVLNGRSPLVDFAAQYGALWPYLLAAGMALVGTSLGVFTVLASLATGVALLALFDVLRRVARRTLVALALFLPLLATSLFMMRGPAYDRYSLVNLMGTWPLRYAGPCFLAWLLARHLDGAWPQRRWPLFLLGGLVAMNNGDFGIPALAATLAALLWVERPSPARIRLLASDLAIGLAAAFALVALLTLVRAGSLPHLGLLFRYARLFAVAGFGMQPIVPVIGVSTLVFLTHVAAIGAATARAAEGERDRLLTGLLAWSGVFGLGVGSYYVGRSHPEVLTNMFPAWGLSLTLLTVVVGRQLAARASRRPSAAQLACLVGFGVLVCSLAQTPAPWTQVERLGRDGSHPFRAPQGQSFIDAHTRRGERVAILLTLGHRIGANLGIVDVTPYTGLDSMPTVEQLRETVDDLRRAGGHKVFLPDAVLWPEVGRGLERLGFRRAVTDHAAGMLEYADR